MSLISYLTRIHFADRVLEDALEAELARLGILRPLVVTDRGPGVSAAWARLAGALPRSVATSLFAEVGAEPREAACCAAAQAFAEGACDGVVGFGGAAAIDVAKAVGLAGGDAAAIAGHLKTGATMGGTSRRGAARRVPVVAIPTSADSGAGLSCSAGIRCADGRRATLSGARLIPAAVLCDPTLTLDAGPEATAAAGMDALTHCLESYLGAAFNPPADGIALEGLRRVAEHLERAVADGADLSARRELLAGALNGGLAEQKGLGGVHALSHAIEETRPSGPRHGSLSALLLPQVLEFNAPAVGARYRAIKEAMRLPARADLATAIDRLGARLCLPARLAPLGLDAPALGQVASRAEADPANRTNPRLAAAEDYRAMLEAVL